MLLRWPRAQTGPAVHWLARVLGEQPGFWFPNPQGLHVPRLQVLRQMHAQPGARSHHPCRQPVPRGPSVHVGSHCPCLPSRGQEQHKLCQQVSSSHLPHVLTQRWAGSCGRPCRKGSRAFQPVPWRPVCLRGPSFPAWGQDLFVVPAVPLFVLFVFSGKGGPLIPMPRHDSS